MCNFRKAGRKVHSLVKSLKTQKSFLLTDGACGVFKTRQVCPSEEKKKTKTKEKTKAKAKSFAS